MLLCDKLFRVHPLHPGDARFIAYALSTTAARLAIEVEATGASDSMQNIGQDTIRELRVWLPTEAPTRVEIADRLDEALVSLQALDVAVSRQIDLLQERRQALITAAVTGQIEIPGVAA